MSPLMVVSYDDDLEPIGVYNDKAALLDDIGNRWTEYIVTADWKNNMIYVSEDGFIEQPIAVYNIQWFHLNTWGG